MRHYTSVTAEAILVSRSEIVYSMGLATPILMDSFLIVEILVQVWASRGGSNIDLCCATEESKYG